MVRKKMAILLIIGCKAVNDKLVAISSPPRPDLGVTIWMICRKIRPRMPNPFERISGLTMVKRALVIFTMTLMCSMAQAQQRMYIDDNNQVPLRTGQSLEYRIIHGGLAAGTPVVVLEQNPETGYSRVRIPDGREGWLLTRYLTAEPIARDKLKAVEKELAQIKSENAKLLEAQKSLLEEAKRLQTDNAQLTNQVQQLQDELQHIKRISENAVNLDRRNQELRESNQQLKSEVELLSAENMRLRDNSDSNKMLLGAGLVGAGMFIAIIIPWLRPQKKSSWA